MVDDVKVSDDPIIAADVIGNVAYQRTKQVFGVDNVATDVSASDPLPIDVKTIVAIILGAGTAEFGRVRISDGTTQATVVPTGGTHQGAAVGIIGSDGEHVTFPPPIEANSGTITGNTSAYQDGDVYHSTQMTFSAVVGSNGGTGHILGARIYDTDAIGKDMRLHLYRKSQSGQTLNNEYLPSDANVIDAIGSIDFVNWRIFGTTSAYSVGTMIDGKPIAFKCDAGVDDIFGFIETLDAPTYTSTTPITIDVVVQPD